MFGMKTRYWFVAKHNDSGQIDYVVTATSLRNAKKAIGSLDKIYTVTLANWRQLKRAINANKPKESSQLDTPCGSLCITVNNRSVWVVAGD